MIITWLGHSFFKIETADKVIGIDPFEEEIVGLKPARFKADILLISHNHSGHNNSKVILGEPFLLDSPGEIEIDGIFIEGIETYHDNKSGIELGKNTIFMIKSEGLNLVFMGDFGEKKLKEEVIEKLGDVDILFVPVSGKSINHTEAANLISQIEPKYIIPMHYKVEGVKLELGGVEKFVKELGINPEKLEKLVIRKSNISAEQDTKLVILQNQ